MEFVTNFMKKEKSERIADVVFWISVGSLFVWALAKSFALI